MFHIIFLAIRSVRWSKICRKCDSGRGSAPDPTGRAHDAPPDLLVGWGAATPPIPRAVLTNGHTGHVPSAPGFFFLFEGPQLAVVKKN